MMKFFRKHQKWILLGMAVLMVLFLTPSMFQGNRGGRVARSEGQYTLGGKTMELQTDDVVAAMRELDILGRLAITVRQDAGRYVQNQFGKESGPTWCLWTRLIAHYGIAVTEHDRRDFYLAYELTDESVNEIMDKARTTLSEVNRAIDHLIALDKLSQMMLLAAEDIPEYDVRLAVRDISDVAHVNLVTPNLDRLKAVLGPPSEAQLRTQFDLYKDKFKPRADEPKGFGYRIPPKVAVEMLVVDAAALADRPELVGISDQDAYQYWTSHPRQFPAATQPALGSFEKDLARVKREMALASPNNAASPAQARAIQMLEQSLEIASAWQKAKKPVVYGPAGARPEATLAGEMQASDKYSPTIVKTPLFSREDEAKWQEELAKWREQEQEKPGKWAKEIADTQGRLDLLSAEEVGGNRYPLLGVAFNSKQLLPPNAQLPAGFEPLELNEQRGVYQAGNKLLIWRLTEAVKDRPPDGLDEVREQVVADVQDTRAGDLAREKLHQIEALVKGGTPLAVAVAKVSDELAARAATQPAATQSASTQPSTRPEDQFLKLDYVAVRRRDLFNDQRIMQAVFQELLRRRVDGQQAYELAMAESRVIRVQPPFAAPSDQVVEKAFELAAKAAPKAPEGERLAFIDDKPLGVIALEQLASLTPANENDYRVERAEVLQIMRRRAVMAFRNAWFDKDDLHRRLSYKPANPERENRPAGPAGPEPEPVDFGF